MGTQNITTDQSINQIANYRVTINDLTVCTFPDIGTALNHAWNLCRQQGIPAEYVDIKCRNNIGLYLSIWEERGGER